VAWAKCTAPRTPSSIAVAIKVLPSALAQDPERLARFEREAKVLAALNHPNIAQVYGLEQSDGVRALVMELVPGETLGHSIKFALPLETALNYAKQIADALEASHEKGITHRDLKPANIMITPDGLVKVLDFGLAAFPSRERDASGNPSDSPTLTISPTRAGMILGTAAYMSPEQAAGKPVDKRADIWSFGVVLWEMLTGEQLFKGETVSHILASVLKDEPDLTRVPLKVRRLLRRCLEKDPKKRLRNISVAMELVEEEPAAPALRHSQPRYRAWTTAAVSAVAAVALGFVHFRESHEDPRVITTSVLPPDKSTYGNGSMPMISPDGRRLVVAIRMSDQTNRLWVRELASEAGRLLAGADNATNPFWSPDSRFVAFFADGKLKKIDVAGGPAITLCDTVSGRGGTCNKDGIIVFAPNANRNLFRVSAAGGSVSPVTTLDQALQEDSHRYPWFLPDGHHFLFTVRTGDAGKTGIYVGDLDSGTRRFVVAANSNAVYAEPNYVLYGREGTLMAQPFDAGRLQTTGDAVPIAEQVDFINDIQGQFSASEGGVLVYTSGSGVRGSRITWFDRQGKAVGTVGEAGFYRTVSLSPDGTRAIINDARAQNDLWLFDLGRRTSTRFTFDPRTDQDGIWSPDGSQIVWGSTRKGPQDLYRKGSNGAGEEQVLLASDQGKRPSDWSKDGHFILYETSTLKTREDLMTLPLKADGLPAGPPIPFLSTTFNEVSGRFSPDGHWVAYISDESGRPEVYVRPFPTSSSGGKWQVSTAGGVEPIWRRDGKELFYLSADRRLMSVEVSTSPSFKAAVPKALFTATITGGAVVAGVHRWDVAPDGQRFLINVPSEAAVTTPMTLVVNWQEGLKK